MIKKAQHWLAKYVGYKWAYRIVFASYIVLTMIPLILVGVIFNVLVYLAVATIVTNGIRRITFGFHMTNGKCMYLTTILIIVFGTLANNIPLVYSFFIALWCVRDIYLKSPLKLTVKGKDKKWHEDRILLILGLCLGVATVGLYFDWYVFTNSILCSLIMVDLTLFLNKNELTE